MNRLVLSDAERAFVRALGGIGYVGVIEFAPNRRGRAVQPERSQIYRSEEAAQAAIANLQYRNYVSRREVVLVSDEREQMV